MPAKVTFASSTQSIGVQELQTRWHNEQDKRRSVSSMLAEARRLRGLMARGKEHLGREDYLECVGIEKYLSQEVLSEITSRNQEHINTILASQYFHDHSMLAQVSEKSSNWSTVRARTLALNLLIE